MKKIMILGSVKYFENLVISAKEEGIYTIVCDNRKDTPAKKICDEAIDVDVMDIHALKKIAIEKKIDGILTSFNDLLLEPYTYLANELKIPCIIKPEQLGNVTNKLLMKKIFTDNKIESPNYWILDSVENAMKTNINFPVVMKPLDSCGSKGIFFVNNIDELKENFKETQEYSSDNNIIIEEFYESEEIQGLCWVNDGEAHVIYVGDRELVNIHRGRPGKPIRLMYPSKYCYQYEDEIKSIYQRIATAFGIQNGPIYVQMLVGKDGIKVNEMMTRLPGGCDYLAIKEATGLDIGKLMVKFSIGEKIDFNKVKEVNMKLDKCVYALPIYVKGGTIGEISGMKEVGELPYVFNMFSDFCVGDIIDGTGDMKQDIGRIFGIANNIYHANSSQAEIHNIISIKNISGERMINNF